MATLDDVERVIGVLPEVTVGARYGNTAWSVGKKVFAWERPFSKADLKRFGDETPPTEPILALITEDLGDKEAILSAHPRSCFTITHFENYPAVLVHLESTAAAELEELVVDAWLVAAPPASAEAFLRNR